MIHQFIMERLPDAAHDIIIEMQSGQHHLLKSFEELDEAMETTLSLEDRVLKISILSRESKPEIKQRRFLWFVVEFIFHSARFNLMAEDSQGELRHWADDSYTEMQRLFSLFQPSPEFEEVMKRDFRLFYPDRRRQSDMGVVVLDYDGNIKNRIFNELASGPEVITQRKSTIGWRWVRDKNIWLAILSAILLLAILLLSIYS